MWWKGPDFLRKNQSEWNHLKREINLESDEDLELIYKPSFITAIITFNADFIERVSDFKRLIRYVTIWRRYFQNLRAHKNEKPIYSSPISVTEFEESIKCVVKIVQKSEFSNFYKQLCFKQQVLNDSKLRSLNPFVDENELIRVCGRIRNAEHINYDNKFPMVLPKNHHFTIILARYYHHKYQHSGPQTLLCLLRQRFWILNGKSVCKKVFRECIKCFKAKPLNAQQSMGELPQYRLQPIRAFVNVGIDYFGPLYATTRVRGRKPIKMYGAIFICLSTRAVHIELVEDLTTNAFIAALQCFVSRRGHPMNIFSDNATNFVGARNELLDLQSMLNTDRYKSEIQHFATENHISWHFIAPRSPHQGGIWEAAVKSAKTHIKRSIGNQLLTAIELRTFLTQTEACLNSRPLSAMSDDPNDLSSLTLGHFLIGAPVTAIIQPNLQDLKISRLTRWQLVQHMLQSFWKRWSLEYLTNLQQRQKGWNKKSENNKIGILVFIKEDNMPPQSWLMGRVVQVFTGKDELVRVVQVKTSKREFRRSIQKICPLPLHESSE